MIVDIPTRITDPETLALMAEELRRSFEDPPPIVEDVPEPPPIEPARKQMPQVRLPHARIPARAWNWLILQVATPYRFKRSILWSLRLPLRAWSFLRVIASEKESPYEKEERDTICSECPFRHYRMRRTSQGVVMDEHCSKCGCPDWYFSRNEVRNRYSGWHCPERKHAGPYPDDDLRKHLEDNGYDPKVVFAGGGGCTGCGCGKGK